MFPYAPRATPADEPGLRPPAPGQAGPGRAVPEPAAATHADHPAATRSDPCGSPLAPVRGIRGRDHMFRVNPLTGESAWGAVPGLPAVRFPMPLSEPGVRLSSHRALHKGCCRAGCRSGCEGVGDHVSPVAVPTDRDAARVEQRDLACRDRTPPAVRSGEPSADVLPSPAVPCALPVHQPPPGVLRQVSEGAGGYGMPELVGPATDDLVEPDQRGLQVDL